MVHASAAISVIKSHVDKKLTRYKRSALKGHPDKSLAYVVARAKKRPAPAVSYYIVYPVFETGDSGGRVTEILTFVTPGEKVFKKRAFLINA